MNNRPVLEKERAPSQVKEIQQDGDNVQQLEMRKRTHPFVRWAVQPPITALAVTVLFTPVQWVQVLLQTRPGNMGLLSFARQLLPNRRLNESFMKATYAMLSSNSSYIFDSFYYTYSASAMKSLFSTHGPTVQKYLNYHLDEMINKPTTLPELDASLEISQPYTSASIYQKLGLTVLLSSGIGFVETAGTSYFVAKQTCKQLKKDIDVISFKDKRNLARLGFETRLAKCVLGQFTYLINDIVIDQLKRLSSAPFFDNLLPEGKREIVDIGISATFTGLFGGVFNNIFEVTYNNQFKHIQKEAGDKARYTVPNTLKTMHQLYKDVGLKAFNRGLFITIGKTQAIYFIAQGINYAFDQYCQPKVATKDPRYTQSPAVLFNKPRQLPSTVAEAPKKDNTHTKTATLK